MVGILVTVAAVGALPTYILAGWLIGRSGGSRARRGGGWGGSAVIDNQRQQMAQSVVLRRHAPRVTRFRDALMGHLYIDGEQMRFRPMPLSFIKAAWKFSLRPEQIVQVRCSSDSGVIFLQLHGDNHEIPITVTQPEGLRDALIRLLGPDRVRDYDPFGSTGTGPNARPAEPPSPPNPHPDHNREAR